MAGHTRRRGCCGSATATRTSCAPVGNVLRDQFMFMHRCGFDAFEVADQAAVDEWIEAISEISVWYQPTGDGRAPVSVLRRRSERPTAIPIGAT